MRVLVVDDHLIVRREIRRLVTEAGAVVVAEAATAAGAVAAAANHLPDVIVLDLDLPDGNGLEIMQRIHEVAPASRVVVLTVSTGEADIRRALAAGAVGYLTKDLSGAAVVGAISNVAAGLTTVTPKAVASLLSHSAPRSAAAREAISQLSPRELEVLRLLADGLSAAEAAERLGISVRTIESHARSVLNRLGARNRADAVRKFVEAGLGDGEQ
jgi:DNA-binding NarL/FixJ family response regulator